MMTPPSHHRRLRTACRFARQRSVPQAGRVFGTKLRSVDHPSFADRAAAGVMLAPSSEWGDATMERLCEAPDRLSPFLSDRFGAREQAGGLDVARDWAWFGSHGDQQWLILTRAVLAGPRFALPDRVDTTLEPNQVRQAIRRLTGNSITPIHPAEAAPSVARYDAVLKVAGDGSCTWEWTDARPVPDRGEVVGESRPVVSRASMTADPGPSHAGGRS